MGDQLLVKLRLQILIPKFMLPDRLFMAAYWRGVRRSGNSLLTQGGVNGQSFSQGTKRNMEVFTAVVELSCCYK